MESACGGRPELVALHTEMRRHRPDVSRMAFFAFDLLFQNSVDLRGLSLTERQRDLRRHRANRRVPCLYLVELSRRAAHCSNGAQPMVEAPRFRLCSGPSRHWVKTKCANWKAENAERHRLFADNKIADPHPKSAGASISSRCLETYW